MNGRLRVATIVAFWAALAPGGMAGLKISASATDFVDAWID
jgi:hypothetical protein